MESAKEELMKQIEEARLLLNLSIEQNESYEKIYSKSIFLDKLIEQYMVEEYQKS